MDGAHVQIFEYCHGLHSGFFELYFIIKKDFIK